MAVVLKFGEMAISMKIVTPEQVEEGLRVQEDARKKRLAARSLGAVLHDKGYLDLVQVEAIMKSLGFPPDRCRLIPDVELRALLGRGASGAVYRGFSTSLNEEVAIKVRAPRIASTDDPHGNRFRAEAKIGLRLVHPNIVRLFDAGETQDFTYHVLECVDGAPLDTLLKQQGRLPEKNVVDIGMQLASALECAGREGIIHRDIKPANVLLARTGRAKLCDLGLAKDTRRGTMLTADGVLLGSPFYIAPEYASTGALDGRSDIYSLGVTLFHCATGAVPFPGKSAVEILHKVVNEVPPDARSIAPDLSEGFVMAVRRMMAKSPDDRYQTPTEVVAAFRALRSGAGGPPAPARRGFWRRLLGLFSRSSASAAAKP
jgi:serine/threonine-protein kinase